MNGRSIPASDETQVLRSVALVLVVSWVAYALMLSGRIAAEARAVDPWWTFGAVVLVFVCPAVSFGVVVVSGRVALVRRAAAATATGFMIAVATWVPAWDGGALAASSWLSFVPGLAAMSAAAAWRPAAAIAYLFVATAAAQAVNQHREPGLNFAYPLEFTYSFGFSLVFVAIVLEARRTARMLDRTEDSARARAAETAAAEALVAQQLGHAAVIHDWVLSTLVAAERLPHSPQLRRRAATALAKIEARPFLGREVGPGRAVEVIQTAVAQVAAGLEFTATVDGGRALDSEAVDCLAAGCAEAVRNSLRHNPTGIRPRVLVLVTGHGIEATVSDEGIGFDPAAVAADRWGVNGSLRRLDRIAGGAVTITSAPGLGTTVAFRWRRPPAATGFGIRDFLGIQRRAAAAVTTVYLVGVCSLAVMSVHGTPTVGAGLALFGYCLMAAVFVGAPGDPIAAAPSWLAVAGPLGAWSALAASPANTTVEQLWPASATAAIYVLLMLRGRPAAAWLGQLATAGVCVLWAAGHHLPVTGVVLARIADVAPLVGGTVFARMIRPRLDGIVRLRGTALSLARQAAAARTARDEHDRQLAAFDATARAVLTRLTLDRPLTTAERRECGLLEALLRDRLRGRLLAESVLADHVRHARARGVTVDLYDDRDGAGITPAVWDQVVTAVTAALTGTVDGTVTIRLPPAGRDTVATVVARGSSGTHRVSIRGDADATTAAGRSRRAGRRGAIAPGTRPECPLSRTSPGSG